MIKGLPAAIKTDSDDFNPAFIAGVIPLIFASGAGAEMRHAIKGGGLRRHAERDLVRPVPDAGRSCRDSRPGGRFGQYHYPAKAKEPAVRSGSDEKLRRTLFIAAERARLLTGCAAGGPRLLSPPSPVTPAGFGKPPAGLSADVELAWWWRLFDDPASHGFGSARWRRTMMSASPSPEYGQARALLREQRQGFPAARGRH